MRTLRQPIAAAAAVAAILAAGPLLAQRSADAAPADESPSVEQMRDTIENVLGRIWTPRSRFTDGPHTRRAFRTVVAAAREATVQVRSDGKRVAYGGVVGPDGWVLTKASQLHGAIIVRLANGDAYPAKIVGVDRDFDLAMLKLDAIGLPALDLDPADGEYLVTAERAPREADSPAPSDDAEAESEPEPGESAAGPRAGDWVATVGYGRDPAAIGVVSVEPRKIGRRRGILGIRMAPDADRDTSAEDPPSAGVRIEQVFDDTGASRAGLKKGDVILRIDGVTVADNAGVSDAIQVHYPGEDVSITVLRGAETLRFVATLTGQVRDFGVSRSQYQNSLGGRLSERRFGFPVALQHDTVLRPEDCGGPIVDLEGRVVGFNISRAGRTETFALPTAAVRERLFELMSGRLAPRPPATAKAAG